LKNQFKTKRLQHHFWIKILLALSQN